MFHKKRSVRAHSTMQPRIQYVSCHSEKLYPEVHSRHVNPIRVKHNTFLRISFQYLSYCFDILKLMPSAILISPRQNAEERITNTAHTPLTHQDSQHDFRTFVGTSHDRAALADVERGSDVGVRSCEDVGILETEVGDVVLGWKSRAWE